MNNMLINGQPGDQLPATDRGLHYGDGVFETLAVIKGSPRLWQQHITRLHRGCARLGIPMPDSAQLLEEVAQVALRGAACVVKIIVTRGSGGRGYRAPAVVEPTRLVVCYPFPDYPPSHAAEGVAIRLCDTTLGCNPRLAGIKHLNRLEQVLARSEWDDDAIAEGIMLDGEGHLIDGTMSNIFLVVDGVLHTPELSRCGVEGVMRAAVIEVACQQSIPLHIKSVTLQMLEGASEVFVTNSLFGIWPVRRCAHHRYGVGAVTRSLQQALNSVLERSHA